MEEQQTSRPWLWQPGQSGNPATQFRPGQSGNPAGARLHSRKARHADLMAQLSADMGGIAALSPGDVVMLGRAVDLLLSQPTSTDEHTRLVNGAMRIINGIRKRAGRLVAI
jgi:hypothetical protein